MSNAPSSTQLQTVAELMAQLRSGKSEAAGKLVEHLYPELRRLAAAKLAGQRANHSWQPTLLVHELYLELTRMRSLRAPNDPSVSADREKATFLNLAGIMMQRRLIEHARPLFRKMPKLDLNALGNAVGDAGEYDTLHFVERLLDGLAALNPRFRTVVECKVFMGMTLAEIGVELGCSERTVATDWAFIRRWLASELDDGCASNEDPVAGSLASSASPK